MISLIYPYYNHRQTLAHHLLTWNTYSLELKKQVEFIIIDDHSTSAPLISPVELNLRVYRVIDNIIWNYGAKNLGVQEARGDWVLLSELDHLINESSLRRILSLERKSNIYYKFFRANHHPESDVRYSDRPHMATWYLDRKTFWESGGIDEDFSGAYGHDDTWFEDCLKRQGCSCILPPREDIELTNYSGNLYFPDSDLKDDPSIPRDTTRNRQLLEQKRRRKMRRGATIRFSFEKVYEWQF